MSASRMDAVLSRLQGVRAEGQAWVALCPAHEDRKPSLRVAEGDDGRVLVKCRAGCDFAAVVAASVAVGAACGYAAAWYLNLDDSPGVLLVAVASGIYVFAQIPFGWLASRVAAQRVEILTNFAVMLDLLQIAVEGGMGLAAAWATVTDAIGRRGGALAAEMRRVDVQVGLGASWPKALHDSSERTGVAEFGALGSLLGQAERFGTEVGRAIRVQCDAMRHEEVESIEERAHRASVKVVIPLVGLLLPATILVTFVPLLIIVIGALADVAPD